MNRHKFLNRVWQRLSPPALCSLADSSSTCNEMSECVHSSLQ